MTDLSFSDTSSYSKIKNSQGPITTPQESEQAAFNPLLSKTLSKDAPSIVHEAARKEAAKPVQVVDANTAPHHVQEIAPGKPVPIILAPEERPLEDIFQNIVNFRDVGGNANRDSSTDTFKPLNIFRSGRLDDANTADLSLMKEKYNIVCVIDLRAETEGKMGEDLINTFPASAIAEQLKPTELLNPAGSKKPTEPQRRKEKPEKEVDTENSRVTYFVNFAGRRFRYYSVWKPLSLRQKLKTIRLMATRRKPDAIMYIGQAVIEPRGLFGLNQAFIDYCGGEIVQALKIMGKAHHYPLLVHCTQGKDRTGLVIALALSLCGVSEENIVKDYARTQQGLTRQRDVMIEEMRKTGLDPSFSDSPPEIMTKVLQYIRSSYGSPEDYLRRNGLTDADISNIRQCLLVQ